MKYNTNLADRGEICHFSIMKAISKLLNFSEKKAHFN